MHFFFFYILIFERTTRKNAKPGSTKLSFFLFYTWKSVNIATPLKKGFSLNVVRNESLKCIKITEVKVYRLKKVNTLFIYLQPEPENCLV